MARVEVPGAAPAIIWCADRGRATGTVARTCCGDPRRVHPRARRAGTERASGKAVNRGSSPRARGDPRPPQQPASTEAVHPRARGAIPSFFGSLGGRRWVYPRARGGTREPLSPFQRLQGSSPRAGPSRVRSWSRSKARVYSRVRGAAGRRPPGRRQRERFISCACGAIVGDTPGAAISRGASARVRRDRRVLRAPRLFPAAWRAFLSSPGVTSVSPRGRLLPAASTLGVS